MRVGNRPSQPGGAHLDAADSGQVPKLPDSITAVLPAYNEQGVIAGQDETGQAGDQ